LTQDSPLDIAAIQGKIKVQTQSNDEETTVIKREAFEIARRFMGAHPTLAHRPVRIVEVVPEGEDMTTELYVVQRGPRGGMRRSRLIDAEQDGAMIHVLQSGDVLMRKELAGGWPTYDSTPVLPHMESPGHAGRTWQSEFTTAEKITSARWALDHGVYENRAEGERILTSLQEQQAVEQAWEEMVAGMEDNPA
jgi:hypothetical protein